MCIAVHSHKKHYWVSFLTIFMFFYLFLLAAVFSNIIQSYDHVLNSFISGYMYIFIILMCMGVFWIFKFYVFVDFSKYGVWVVYYLFLPTVWITLQTGQLSVEEALFGLGFFVLINTLFVIYMSKARLFVGVDRNIASVRMMDAYGHAALNLTFVIILCASIGYGLFILNNEPIYYYIPKIIYIITASTYLFYAITRNDPPKLILQVMYCVSFIAWVLFDIYNYYHGVIVTGKNSSIYNVIILSFLESFPIFFLMSLSPSSKVTGNSSLLNK